MNTENLREFVKDLFTLRTVWIDKGSGRWAVRKRLHPLLRGILCTSGVVLCAVVYSGLHTPRVVEAEPQPAPKIMTAASLPKPEPAAVKEAAMPEKQSIIIPLAQSKRTIVLPSEQNPELDQIITPIEKPAMPAVNSGKYSIRISKGDYTLTLYRGDEVVKTYPIAVGKNPGDKQRTGDHRTPVGDFKIVSIENASKWSHDFRDGKGKIAGAYGPWFLRLDANGWKGIGIHGTHDPDSRGTMATEGCIRLSNEDIAELKQYAYRNMPVVIREN
ncbi:MAG: L,D-transpeptidase [Synergistaceae bacterium]|nr:L,D-transpeptidase [Synergistaceae bacterium]